MKFPGDSLFYWAAGCTASYFLWAILTWTFNGTFVYLPLTSRVSFTSLLSIIGLFISYRIVTVEARASLVLAMSILCLLVAISSLDDIVVYFELVNYCSDNPARSYKSTCNLMLQFYNATAFMVSVCCASIAALHVFTGTCYYRAFLEQRSKLVGASDLTVTVGKPV